MLSARAVRLTKGATINARTVLALSGFVMLLFVVAHLAGNLLAFAGSSSFNAYSRSLREVGAPFIGTGVALTIVRVALAAALVSHLSAHALLLGRGGAPSLTLLASGGVILIFVAIHLAQLTFGAGAAGFTTDDPYRNLVTALASSPVAIAYVIVATAVAAHVRVGVSGGMRSLGLVRTENQPIARVLAPALAIAIFLAMAAVPVASLLGLL